MPDRRVRPPKPDVTERTTEPGGSGSQPAGAETISSLERRIHEELARHNGLAGRYVLLDAPDYPNVGDSAIYLGTLKFLEAAFGRKPDFVSTNGDCDWAALDRIDPAATIFLQGGGNFGDLWPWFQDFRETVLDRYPGRRIVQLPQTIHFSGSSRLDKAASAIRRQGNFVLLVRDRQSFELASRHFDCEISMCPDMAFLLGPLQRPYPPSKPVVGLLRTDKERDASFDDDTRTSLSSIAGIEFADWIVEPTWLRKREKVRMAVRFPLALPFPQQRKGALLALLAEARVKRGLAILSEGRVVISDRLHSHILCTLLGIPHVVLDNSYGKISGFHEAWTKPIAYARFASSPDQAIREAGRLLEEASDRAA